MRIAAPVASAVALAVLCPTSPSALLSTRAARRLDPNSVFCRLYLDPHDKFTRVGPSQGAQLRASLVGGNLSRIFVNYTGFDNNPAAQNAFQAAVNIWQTEVSSAVPIFVEADFTDLGSSGLLGEAGSAANPQELLGGLAATFYPFPLANNLAGTDTGMALGPEASDITGQFNSNASVRWYFGTDGLTPSGKVDFESVVLHELGHGLGFIGGASLSGGKGAIRTNGDPYVYDLFPADAPTGGNHLVNSPGIYPDPGTALAAALQSNSVYWDGVNANAANSGVRPKLYAPVFFQTGTSYDHLDENTYPAGNPNSLMTPFLGTAEAIHSPGPIMIGMFADMGWGTPDCPFTLGTASANVGSAATTGTVQLTVPAGCAWTASSGNTSIATITSAVSGSGSATVSYSVVANSGFSQRSVTLTIGSQLFNITQAGTGPTMTLDKTSLEFAGVSNGSSFISRTGTQTVRLIQSGAGTVHCSVTSNQPWLVVSPPPSGTCPTGR